MSQLRTELIERLGWDSDFFGLAIGRVIPTRLDERTITILLKQAAQQKLRCLYFEADPQDAATVLVVEQAGFHLVDVRVILEYSFNRQPAPVVSELFIGPPLPQEMSRLQDMAAEIGRTSRFYFDQNFGPGQSERLYRQWIQNACLGFADVVFIARRSAAGEATGLITCALRGDVAHIQLVGVHTAYRRQGIGAGLVQAGLDWASAQGARAMQVVTQGRNVPAQRLYQQMGFFTRSMTLYYHKWL